MKNSLSGYDSKTDHASLNGENGLRDGFTSAHAPDAAPRLKSMKSMHGCFEFKLAKICK